MWKEHDISHALTISLGLHPTRFAEEDMFPIMKRLVRETTHQLRGLPKRKALGLNAQHPDALFLAGFYEATNAGGELFPHWHGAVTLRADEEQRFRDLLCQCIGEDSQNPRGPLQMSLTTRPLITHRYAKPTFHLASLATPGIYIRYANKKIRHNEASCSTTHDFLA
jgi:hypothetical protein